MTITEFVNKYDLHDSLIDNVSHDISNNKVTIHINFAYWMQEWYKDNMPETAPITIMFDNVSSFVCPENANWEQISIIKAIPKEEALKIALMNDITDEYLEIVIKCDSVSVC